MDFLNISKIIGLFFVIAEVIFCFLSYSVDFVLRFTALVIDPIGEDVVFITLGKGFDFLEIGVGVSLLVIHYSLSVFRFHFSAPEALTNHDCSKFSPLAFAYSEKSFTFAVRFFAQSLTAK